MEDTAQEAVADLTGNVNALRDEAAKYRTERNAARQQLTAARHAIIRNSKSMDAISPDAVEDVIAMLDTDGLFDEAGMLDGEQLTAQLQQLVMTKPYLGNPARHRLPQSVREVLSHSATQLRPRQHDSLTAALLLG